MFAGIVADLFPEHARKEAASKKKAGKKTAVSALRMRRDDLVQRGLEPEPSFVLVIQSRDTTSATWDDGGRRGMCWKSEAVRVG